MTNENIIIPPLQDYDINLGEIVAMVVGDNAELQGRITLVNEFDPDVPTVVAMNFIRKVLYQVYLDIETQTAERCDKMRAADATAEASPVAATVVEEVNISPKEVYATDDTIVPADDQPAGDTPGTHLGWRHIGR